LTDAVLAVVEMLVVTEENGSPEVADAVMMLLSKLLVGSTILTWATVWE